MSAIFLHLITCLKIYKQYSFYYNMRCFIAVEIPEHIRVEIFHVFEKIKQSGLVAGNFVEKENLHLTLKFFGELNKDEIVKIKKELSEIEFKKFNAETGSIGFFPNEDYIRILWVELAGAEISKLHKKIDDKLFESGIKKDDKNFSSHITVARINSVKDRKMFMQKIKEMKLKKEKFSVDNFSLIKSELTPEGPIYKILEKFELK